ncbi:MAG: pyruvate kinase [Acidobacteria bacterium]|jgi:pyruvate kinase|nr:MAG: pyruvate kinase [Acidobacteriota bacterium]
MRRTKIIVTLGPATASDEVLNGLIDSGVEVGRLNFSHGTHESHADLYHRFRRAATRTDYPVAVLQDLSGPKIRTGRLSGGTAVELHPGQELRIAVGDEAGTSTRIFTTYADLPRAVKPGQVLLLDDGRIELKVLRIDNDEIVTTVVDGDVLGERKGINAPGVALPVEPLTAKDIEDLRFGLQLGVDLVAVSFVRRASDLRQARELMNQAGGREVPLVAKLERPEALVHLEEILEACDAVMVARGDLGLEMPLESVPRAQKEITMAARKRGIPVIVATQVLESMRTQPRPTRAEVSDAANAVDDGVDAIMLAGETAAGAFPVRAVQMLDAVIREAEKVATPAEVRPSPAAVRDHEQALCEAAITLARLGGADAIIAVTKMGHTARQLSAIRSHAIIYAATGSAEVARRLAIVRGVMPLVVSIGDDVESVYLKLARRLRDEGRIEPGAMMVFVNVATDLTSPSANFVKLMRLG